MRALLGRLDRINRWSVIVPVGALALAVVLVIVFDLAEGGEAKPPPLLGEVGTPVRGTFTAPTPTPIGARPTPRPRPTLAGLPGTPEERDADRRQDLLLILGAMEQIRADEGSFPTTGGNIQTLCVYVDIDAGCQVEDVLGEVPTDPAGSSPENGYWYQSDGETMRVFASLEVPVPADQLCDTDYIEFEDKIIVCAEAP